MINVERRDEYPNLLYVHGSESVKATGTRWNLEFEAIRDTLFSDNGIGNFRGNVDFIICYVVKGSGSEFRGPRLDPDAQNFGDGRPLRGIVKQMDSLRDPINASRLGELLSGNAHEVGHYWLVPFSADIKGPGGPFPLMGPNKTAASLNRGDGLQPYPLLGRQGRHWGPFLDAQDSPMDGVNHVFSPGPTATHGYAFSNTTLANGISFDFENMGLITTISRYSDLDLYIMGVEGANPQIPPLDVMRAKWVFPDEFHSGLYAELDDGSVWYHGYYKSPVTLRAAPLSGGRRHDLNLDEPFNPWDRVALRIVQSRSNVKFQARVWKWQWNPALPQVICQFLQWVDSLFGTALFQELCSPMPLKALDCSEIMVDMFGESSSSGPVDSPWQTVATVSGARAVKIGVGARHLKDSRPFVRTKPHLCLWQNSAMKDISLDNMTPVNSVNANNSVGAHTLLPDKSFILPFGIRPNESIKFVHDTNTDDAPRFVMDAPSRGDFAFGGQIDLNECIIIPWAGNGAKDKTFVGERQSFIFPQLDLLSHYSSDGLAKRQEIPIGGRYKMMFCLVSDSQLNEADLMMQLDRLDLIRRAWEVAFIVLTKGVRQVRTNIDLP